MNTTIYIFDSIQSIYINKSRVPHFTLAIQYPQKKPIKKREKKKLKIEIWKKKKKKKRS